MTNEEGTRIAARHSWERAVLDSNLPSASKLICLALATYMSRSQATAFPSKSTLEDDCGISGSTLKRHMRTIIEQGWLVRRPRFTDGGRQRSNVYEARIPGEIAALMLAAVAEGGQVDPPGADQPGGPGSKRTGTRGVTTTPQNHPEEPTIGTLDPGGPYSEEFENLWKRRPRRDGNDPKRGAWRAYCRTRKHGHEHQVLLAKVDGYAAWCRERRKEGTEGVMRLSTFLGPDEPWDQDWEVQLRLDRLDEDQRRRETAGRDPDEVDHVEHGPPPEPSPPRRPRGPAVADAEHFLDRLEKAREDGERRVS